ncbi:MAG: glycosyltransferase family 2 protein [Pseudomonadota bacterium]
MASSPYIGEERAQDIFPAHVSRDLRVKYEPKMPPLGRLLLDRGNISKFALFKALEAQKRSTARLGEILVAQGATDDETIARALAAQAKTEYVDLSSMPPDPRLMSRFDPEHCLAVEYLPFRQRGGTTVIAVTDVTRINEVLRQLPPRFGCVHFVMTTRAQIHSALQRICAKRLTQAAETRTPDAYSCRNWSTQRTKKLAFAFVGLVAICAASAPVATLSVFFFLAVFILCLNTSLKAACILSGFIPRRRTRPAPGIRASKALPKISILVPLFKEQKIATALVHRLAQLKYPRELLEVCLVVEADDPVTRKALHVDRLPDWMRVIRVPVGSLKTKPRAMNYALDFTTGSIVGVYDAEDAPDPNQLYKVARKFARSGPQLACLQGVLSFYNGRSNWLARCFHFEYAGWFRVMLPGLQRLGFAIPLGGTTLFFRRSALIELGAWDAHNVTEDADLGMRLARRGYRCEMIETITHEEANSRIWPWIRQRSRWLKGYAITWSVHMRNPWRLLRELGVWKFLGFQFLFLGTLISFFLAPFLWWSLVTFGLGYSNPVLDEVASSWLGTLTKIFILSEGVTFVLFLIAALKLEHRPSLAWLFTLPAYFMFGTLAAYKGLIELAFRPFYWDKTAHGMFGGATVESGAPAGQGSLAVNRNPARINFKAGLKGNRQMVPQRL